MFNIESYFLAPFPVKFLKITYTSPRQLLLSWKEPAVKNGILTKYTIRYSGTYTGTKEVMFYNKSLNIPPAVCPAPKTGFPLVLLLPSIWCVMLLLNVSQHLTLASRMRYLNIRIMIAIAQSCSNYNSCSILLWSVSAIENWFPAFWIVCCTIVGNVVYYLYVIVCINFQFIN